MNIISDEELALSSGDALQCEHCHKVYPVDEWHSCPEGTRALQEQAERENREYHHRRRSRKLVTRQFKITIVANDSDEDFQEALSDLEANFDQGSRSDDILGFAWEVEELNDK